MKLKMYENHEFHLYLLKILKWSDFYSWRYGSVYMCALISVVKCMQHEHIIVFSICSSLSFCMFVLFSFLIVSNIIFSEYESALIKN